ncbi:MAG TPA: thioredoxin domain-containing protein [Allosphingosinicella sp.]|nr:thioredoxin domain-containing protein [Allosphingosinicella sp.]
MRARILIAALAATAALALPAASAPAQRRAVQRDWTQTVVRTPEGGFRMGNPQASVKVIEFLSLTCPHCAQFAAQGAPRLIQDHVRTGRVSLEYRNYVLNGYDLAASFLSRCAPPSRYFDLTGALLAGQRQWMARTDALTEAQRTELRGMQPLAAMQRIVALLGLDAIGARHGVPASVQRTCLADQASLTRLTGMREAAGRDFGVHATPSFVVNGRLADHVHDWAALEPLLGGR